MVTATRDDGTGLESVDLSALSSRDGAHFRAIIAAKDGLAEAERNLRAAVGAAREAGDSWLIIGAALGVSKQAAQQRFGG